MNSHPIPLPTPESSLDLSKADRLLADMLRQRSVDETFIKSLAAKKGYAEYAAFMLWDLIVHGQAQFSDGRVVAINDQDEWLKLVRFVFQHLDGPAKSGAEFNGVNIFKVYAGFDPDRV